MSSTTWLNLHITRQSSLKLHIDVNTRSQLGVNQQLLTLKNFHKDVITSDIVNIFGNIHIRQMIVKQKGICQLQTYTNFTGIAEWI